MVYSKWLFKKLPKDSFFINKRGENKDTVSIVESIIKPNVDTGYYLLDSSLASNTLENNIRTLWMTQRCTEEPVSLGKYRNHNENTCH